DPRVCPPTGAGPPAFGREGAIARSLPGRPWRRQQHRREKPLERARCAQCVHFHHTLTQGFLKGEMRAKIGTSLHVVCCTPSIPISGHPRSRNSLLSPIFLSAQSLV